PLGRLARAALPHPPFSQPRGREQAYRRYARKPARDDPESCYDGIDFASPQIENRHRRQSISAVATSQFIATALRHAPRVVANQGILVKSSGPPLGRHSREWR